MLGLEEISAILVPQHLPMKNMVMPTLVHDPEQLDGIDPLAPAFPMNAAKLVSRLTRKPIGGKCGSCLRPCEIRAFFELVKLKQGHTDDLSSSVWIAWGLIKIRIIFISSAERLRSNDSWILSEATFRAGKALPWSAASIWPPACKACEFPIPTGADILIGLYGIGKDDLY